MYHSRGKKHSDLVGRLLNLNVLRARKLYFIVIIIATIFLVIIFPLTTKEYYWNRTNFNFRAYVEPQILELPEIQKLCKNTDWYDDVYLDCYYLNMGAFNAINRLHVCIRWAMDAGVGLIVPAFTPRDPKNISNLWSSTIEQVPLNYLMDDEFLWEALAHNCPRLKIAQRSELGEVMELTGLWGTALYPIKAGLRKGEYKDYLRKHIEANLTHSDKELPLVVREKDPMGAWNVVSDPPEFQIDFHRLVTHFSKPLMRAAHGILNKLPYIYYGIHYRQEKDWTNVNGFPTDDQIAQFPLTIPQVSNNPVFYTACGDVAKLNNFKTRAKRYGVVVVDKWDLIDEKDRSFIETLAFDQLGILDFIVLMHSQVFWGFGGSSYSQSVGLWRHIYQYNDLYFRGTDYQQRLIGPKWTQPVLHDILW